MQRSTVSQANTNKSKSCKDLSISTGHYHHMETMVCNLLTKECVYLTTNRFYCACKHDDL